MRLYQDRILVDTFPAFKKKKGCLANRLVGFNVSGREQVTVEPVYLPLLAVEKHGGVTTIMVSRNRPLFLLFVYERWPFIHFHKIEKEVVE